jgi:hypothetical protein
MPTWTQNGTEISCSTCSETFRVGGSCGCSGTSPTSAAAPDVSQASSAAGVGLSSQLSKSALSLLDVARLSKSAQARARRVFSDLSRIRLDPTPLDDAVGADAERLERPQPRGLADRQITMRVAQLKAIEVELKALRYCGDLAKVREQIEADLELARASAALHQGRQGEVVKH